MKSNVNDFNIKAKDLTPASKIKKLSIFTVATINVAATISIRGMATEAIYGLTSVFYFLFGAFFFLIPVSLSSAEMGSMYYNKKGGVFRWIGEAFGARAGFVAIWLEWIQSVIFYPVLLTFGAVALAFLTPDSDVALRVSANRWFVLAVVIVVFWAATLVNFLGVQVSGAISQWGVVIGTMFPAVVIMALAIAYAATGHPIQMSLDPKTLYPHIHNIRDLALAVSVFLFFCGMEMSSVHVMDMKDPQRGYPAASFIAVFIGVIILAGGSLAVAAMIPADKINLTQSLLYAYYYAWGSTTI